MKKLTSLLMALMLVVSMHVCAQNAGTAQKVAVKKETTTTVEEKKEGRPLKKDGTPDRRYKENKHVKKDGTPDMRYKANKEAAATKTATAPSQSKK